MSVRNVRHNGEHDQDRIEVQVLACLENAGGQRGRQPQRQFRNDRNGPSSSAQLRRSPGLIGADDRNTGGNIMILKRRSSLVDDALPSKLLQEL